MTIQLKNLIEKKTGDHVIKTVTYKGKKIYHIKRQTRSKVLGGRHIKEGWKKYWKYQGSLYDALKEIKWEIDFEIKHGRRPGLDDPMYKI